MRGAPHNFRERINMDWNEFMNSVGYPLLATLLTAAATWIGAKIKGKYEELANDRIIKDTVDACVRAAEQLYKSETAQQRNSKAKECIVELLNSKGLSITDLQLDMLIESVVLGLSHGVGKETQ